MLSDLVVNPERKTKSRPRGHGGSNTEQTLLHWAFYSEGLSSVQAKRVKIHAARANPHWFLCLLRGTFQWNDTTQNWKACDFLKPFPFRCQLHLPTSIGRLSKWHRSQKIPGFEVFQMLLAGSLLDLKWHFRMQLFSHREEMLASERIPCSSDRQSSRAATGLPDNAVQFWYPWILPSIYYYFYTCPPLLLLIAKFCAGKPRFSSSSHEKPSLIPQTNFRPEVADDKIRRLLFIHKPLSN